MKQTFIFTATLVTGLILCSCAKEESAEPALEEQEFTLIVNATLGDAATRTYFVPDGRKVFWLKDDMLGAKYKKTSGTSDKNDNLKMTLVSGEGTASATFKGNYSSKNGATTSAILDGNKIVFYYPYCSTVAKTGSVSDYDNYTLGNTFPKVQNTGDVLMDPNLMFGVGEVSGWPTNDEAECTTKVTMTNVMGVLDFTLKGTGSVKRLHITDLNESAQKMWGDETITIKNGAVESITTAASTRVSDRTIIAEFNKPIEMSADGAHAYVTVLPRTYSKGIQVCVELTNGDYMVKKITNSFEVKGNNAYSLKPLQYASSATQGVGYSDGSTFSYKNFTDSRDSEKYRYITLGSYDIMIDNLRYVPGTGTAEPYEPSNDVNDVTGGFWYPVVLNAEGNAVQFGDANDVKKVGYLYNPSLAITKSKATFRNLLDNAGSDKTKQNEAFNTLRTYAGAQGICPDGWHVPTSDDLTAVCKAAGVTLNGSNGVNISPLAEKGFTMRDFGSFTIINNSKTSGTLNTYKFNKLNAGNLILSTPFRYNTIYIASFNNNDNTICLAATPILSGISLRCVRAAN